MMAAIQPTPASPIGRIPKAVADALKVSNGKRSEIRIENGKLVLRRFG